MHATGSRHALRGAALCVAGLACALAALDARAAGSFDGIWNVTLTCPAAPDGAGATPSAFPRKSRKTFCTANTEKKTKAAGSDWTAKSSRMGPPHSWRKG